MSSSTDTHTATHATTHTHATTTHQTAISWFEIPVQDMDRAQCFYEALLDAPLRRETMGPQTMAVLPYSAPGTGGALLQGPSAPPPGAAGSLLYLNVNPRLDDALARALAAGAQLVQPRVNLPEGMGAFVHVLDSEGNRIGLHALA